MKSWYLFITVSVLAALAPLYRAESMNTSEEESAFPGWYQALPDSALKQIPLTAGEKIFADAFPGKVGLFSDGQRRYIIRWVTQSTRRLHPAVDCFRASGYRIKYLPLWRDSRNQPWSAFEAANRKQILYVREHIRDSSSNNNWSDVSAWYWAAVFGKTKGPWWVVTIVERMENSDTKR